MILLESIICVGVYFRVFSGLGMFWSNVEITKHFAARDERKSQLFKKPAIVDIHTESRSTPTPWCRLTRHEKTGRFVCGRLEPKDPHIYKTVSARILPSIYVFRHCLGNTQSFYYFLHSKTIFVFFRLERRSKTPSLICIGTPLFSTLLSMPSIQTSVMN